MEILKEAEGRCLHFTAHGSRAGQLIKGASRWSMSCVFVRQRHQMATALIAFLDCVGQWETDFTSLDENGIMMTTLKWLFYRKTSCIRESNLLSSPY